MLRKFIFSLFYAVSMFSASVYATEPYFLQEGLSIEYELPSNSPQMFINYMFWAVEANCKIATEDESDDFLIVALAKEGRINGEPISNGESRRITVRPGDSLRIYAESGAKVRITNFGQHTVRAVCTT